MWRDLILNVEGRPHTRLRRLVNQAFTPAAVEAMRPRIRAFTDTLVDGFAADGSCDFVTAFADQLPARVMFDLLDIPAEMHDDMVAWGKALALTLTMSVLENLPAIERAMEGVYAAVDVLTDARRRRPGRDLISALVAAVDGEERLTQQELRSMAVGLIVAAQDTTRNQFALTVATFARHPAQWELLARRPELAAAAVEEGMRYDPTIPLLWRRAAEDVTYRDLAVPAGERVWVLVGNAHREPATFGPTADEFDITAERPAQLSFGHGVHYCLGAGLARVEMTEALPVLARRLRGLALAGPHERRPDVSGIVGLLSLPISFEPEA